MASVATAITGIIVSPSKDTTNMNRSYRGPSQGDVDEIHHLINETFFSGLLSPKGNKLTNAEEPPLFRFTEFCPTFSGVAGIRDIQKSDPFAKTFTGPFTFVLPESCPSLNSSGDDFEGDIFEKNRKRVFDDPAFEPRKEIRSDSESSAPGSPRHSDSPKATVNITPYLHLPQSEAARILGIPASTLSKRWKEATTRKWPHRKLKKLEKKIDQVQNALDKKPKQNQVTQSLQSNLINHQNMMKQLLEPVLINL